MVLGPRAALMPIDDPYDLDFFQKVTNCNWQSQFFMVSMGNSALLENFQNAEMFVDFPGIAGGTPGFHIVAGSLPNGPWIPLGLSEGNPNTFRVTSAMINQELQTDAGAVFKGFGYSIGVNDHFPRGPFVSLLLQVTFTQNFRIRCEFTTGPDALGCFAEVSTIKQNTIKPGLLLGIGINPPLISTASVDMLGNSGSTDFLINPSTLLVTVA